MPICDRREWASFGAKPGPGGSLVGGPRFFARKLRPQGVAGKKAWGRSPAAGPHPRAGRLRRPKPAEAGLPEALERNPEKPKDPPGGTNTRGVNQCNSPKDPGGTSPGSELSTPAGQRRTPRQGLAGRGG
jgi:hypothetical protein